MAEGGTVLPGKKRSPSEQKRPYCRKIPKGPLQRQEEKSILRIVQRGLREETDKRGPEKNV